MPAKLKVQVVAGRGLPVMDRTNETTDAFVEIRLGHVTFKTDVHRKSLSPQWNSDWFPFEVTDEELQIERLQVRVLDHDTYSANDTIGKAYIDLKSLLTKETFRADRVLSSLNHEVHLGGWIPVFDTLHGIRGEVNIHIRAEVFLDRNFFRNSSSGVMVFFSPCVPQGFRILSVRGFVEQLLINDDPEYQWLDKIRTTRASNESRQTLLMRLSASVQQRIGLKAIAMGANAIIGYKQHLDLERESGIVMRGIGTAVLLSSGCVPSISPKRRGSRGATHVAPPFKTADSFEEPLVNSFLQQLKEPPRSLPSYMITRDGGMELADIEDFFQRCTEFPFITASEMPPCKFRVHSISGLVRSQSIKVLDEDHEDLRGAWWNGLRNEILAHVRTLGCNVVLGYDETTTICDDVMVLMASGTAACYDPPSPGWSGGVTTAALELQKLKTRLQKLKPNFSPSGDESWGVERPCGNGGADDRVARGGVDGLLDNELEVSAWPRKDVGPSVPANIGSSYREISQRKFLQRNFPAVDCVYDQICPDPREEKTLKAAEKAVDNLGKTLEYGFKALEEAMKKEVERQKQRERDEKIPRDKPPMNVVTGVIVLSAGAALAVVSGCFMPDVKRFFQDNLPATDTYIYDKICPDSNEEKKQRQSTVDEATIPSSGGISDQEATPMPQTTPLASTLPSPADATVLPCSLVHRSDNDTLQYSQASISCAVCRSKLVPPFLMASIPPPPALPVVGEGKLVHVNIVRSVREKMSYVFPPARDSLKDELYAKELTDALPFLEYETYKELLLQAQHHGANAVFGVQISLSLGEHHIISEAVGTAYSVIPMIQTGSQSLHLDLTMISPVNHHHLSMNHSEESHSAPAAMTTAGDVFIPSTGSAPFQSADRACHHQSSLTNLDLMTASDGFLAHQAAAENGSSSSATIVENGDDSTHVPASLDVRFWFPHQQSCCALELKQFFLHSWRRKFSGELTSSIMNEWISKTLKSLQWKLRRFRPLSIQKVVPRISLHGPDEVQLLLSGNALSLVSPPKRKPSSSSLTTHDSIAITSLKKLPGDWRVAEHLGIVDLFLIREETGVREFCGGLSGLMQTFLAEVLAIFRSHVAAIGGNAVLCFYIQLGEMEYSANRNQAQYLVHVGGDAVRLESGTSNISAVRLP
ncbi:unnamed protein product [Cyprideis torosa]|uniref:Uncharacterized protein n=1 Tax=Cyprideis torosa TaxID=163714 RepID=A0A7R8WE18_9CRUS|nr:unnamed protein product [Cyprideis torosa]CAG0895331.1 unnamed protein product [Cyprideis torosa]